MIKDKFQNPGLIAIGVFLLAIVAYLPSLSTGGAGFFWDTPAVFGGDSFFMVSFEHGYHRPLFDLALQAQRALWGEAALGYHLVNLLLHAFNSVLLFFIVRRLVPDLLPSSLAAFLFALHPAHVEAVTWVFAQPWLIGAFFSLSSFLLYLKYFSSSKPLMALASALSAFLAMLSSQAALLLPVFMVASGLLLGAGRRQRTLGLLLYTLVLGIYAVFFLGTGEFRPAAGTATFGFLNTFFVFGFYIFKLTFPFSLAPLPIMPSSILYPFTALMPFAVGYILYSEGMRREVAALGAMLVLMAPALMIALWANDYSIGYRYMYMPLMAGCVFVAMLMARLRSRQALRLVASVLLIASMSGALWHSLEWTDNTGLWREVSDSRPDGVPPLLNLAATLAAAGRTGEVEGAIRDALNSDEVTTDHYTWITRFYDHLGSGAPDGRMRMYEDLVVVKGEAHARYVMGFISLQRFKKGEQDVVSAQEYLEASVALDDEFTPAHYSLAMVYMYQDKYEAARDEFLKVRDADEQNMNWVDSVKFLTLLNGVSGATGPL